MHWSNLTGKIIKRVNFYVMLYFMKAFTYVLHEVHVKDVFV